MGMRASFDKIAPEWFADEAMTDLVTEQAMLPEETPTSIGLQDLENYFPLAVRRVGQIACHGDDKYALPAAKYIIAANLQLQKAKTAGGEDPVDSFAKAVMAEADRLKERR
jgi:hypothetical protein